MGALQQLFQSYAPAYLQRFAAAVPHAHRKALAALLDCRTPNAGALLYDGDGCGIEQRLPRSCGNRHCPTCQQHKAFDWLARQLAKQLPTHYFMLTFTVPEPLRAFLRSHQRLGYGALFDASANAIKTLAADPKRLNADLPGFLGVLHTWGRELQYHPHIHYLVPGGALSSADRQWHPASATFYLPVRALSRRCRAQFRTAMDRAGVLADIPAAVWDTECNVHCLPVGDGDAALNYLARYVFKVAISDHRIVRVDDTGVTFHYRRVHSTRRRTMTLPVMEFLRRFLQHVLPTRFMKVRHYGFLSPSCAVPITAVKARVE